MPKVKCSIACFVTVVMVCCSHGSVIRLDNHFSYIVLGGDHVAESIGRFLASREVDKTVLILKGRSCTDILEPSEPSERYLEASYLLAESAHYLGFGFIDPFLHGAKVGIAFTNHTAVFNHHRQELYAMDPNLKMLTDARLSRLVYNQASTTVLGLEIELNQSPHYLFASEEIIVAGRCVEDYKLLSNASILSNTVLFNTLRKLPLDIALQSPIITPIFSIDKTSVHVTTDQPAVYLLATELFVDTLSCSKSAQPNARIKVVLNESNEPWIGFIPSPIVDESTTSNYSQIINTLAECAKISFELGDSKTFRKLGLMFRKQHVPGCQDHGEDWRCFVNYTMSMASKAVEVTKPACRTMECENLLTADFRLRSVRKLRLLPFGLTSPFLENWWNKIFSSPTHQIPVEYTTMTGVVEATTANHMSYLIAKLKDRLKCVYSNMNRTSSLK